MQKPSLPINVADLQIARFTQAQSTRVYHSQIGLELWRAGIVQEPFDIIPVNDNWEFLLIMGSYDFEQRLIIFHHIPVERLQAAVEDPHSAA